MHRSPYDRNAALRKRRIDLNTLLWSAPSSARSVTVNVGRSVDSFGFITVVFRPWRVSWIWFYCE
ncbi:hypothetical protein [Novipirellula sp.]|uniref:hypothetical protein n=1 Tax=Novipirellula sp. TaxID=2795430 RepID=UPI00356AD7E2